MGERTRWRAVLAAVAVLAWAQALPAQEPTRTTITIEDLHCAGCAKRVVRRLTTVRGVAAAQAELKTSSVTVTPQAQRAPSPRDLWEAVEKAGFRPTKLVGPAGTFTAKPAS
jgi:copper chaperone CopZ